MKKLNRQHRVGAVILVPALVAPRQRIEPPALIVQAAAQDPKHAEWWLSHRHSERWADRARMEMRHSGKLEMEIAAMSDEALVAEIAALEAKKK